MQKTTAAAILLSLLPSLALAEGYKLHARCGNGAPIGTFESYKTTIISSRSRLTGPDSKMSGKITVQTDTGSQYVLTGKARLEKERLVFNMTSISGYPYAKQIIFLKTSEGKYVNSALDFCASGAALTLALTPSGTLSASRD